MAEVFVASTLGAEGFNRRVAIKRVLPGFCDDPQFVQMFIKEAQLSSRLVHQNIVSVLDFDHDADLGLILIMELVEGRDLDLLLSSGPLPYDVVIYVITEVLRGLDYAHSHPSGAIIHRDVSPHNVLVSWDGSVKLSDFGIAKALDASEVTVSVLFKGKPAYMSPEQANGQPLDRRTDLFSVGVMLWEMLAGRRLFLAEDTRATLAALLFGKVPRPRSVRRGVPKDLERVAMTLLERAPAARFLSAEAAIAALEGCADSSRSGRDALRECMRRRFAATGTSPALTMNAQTLGQPNRRRPRPAVVVAMICAVVLALAVCRETWSSGDAPAVVDAGLAHVDAAPPVPVVELAREEPDAFDPAAPIERWPVDDRRGLRPECVAALKEMQRLTTCVTLSPSERSSLVSTLRWEWVAHGGYSKLSRARPLRRPARLDDVADACRQEYEALVLMHPSCGKGSKP